jgi:hypothetical protein
MWRRWNEETFFRRGNTIRPEGRVFALEVTGRQATAAHPRTRRGPVP